MESFEVRTAERIQFIDVTNRIKEIVARSKVGNGAVLVYVPHTTAACTINENADPDVVRDMNAYLSKLVPHRGDYHHAEGNSDSHIKAAFLGSSQHIIIDQGQLVLGQWQGVYFCEFDGPRRRTMYVQILKANE